MEPPTSNPKGVPPINLQHSCTKGTHHPHPLPPTHREYHPPTYNTHTLKGLTPTNLQLLHINGPPAPQPTGTMTYKLNTHTLMKPSTSNPQGVPPTILQLSHTNGTPYPQPTGSTTHQLTTLIH